MSVRLGPVFTPPSPGSVASGGFTENVPVPSTEFADGASGSVGRGAFADSGTFGLAGPREVCAKAGATPRRAAKANAATAGRAWLIEVLVTL